MDVPRRTRDAHDPELADANRGRCPRRHALHQTSLGVPAAPMDRQARARDDRGPAADLPALARIEVANRPSGAPYVRVDGDAAAGRHLDQRPGRVRSLRGGAAQEPGGMRPRDRRATLGRVRRRVPHPAGAGVRQLTAVARPRHGRQPDLVGEGERPEGAAHRPASRHPQRRGGRSATGPEPTGLDPARVRTVEGRLFPGWWRRDGVFLVTLPPTRRCPPP